MSTATRAVKFSFIGEDKSAGRTMDKLGKQSGGLGSKLAGFGKTAGKALAGVGLAAGAMAVAVGPKLFETGAKLELMGQKASTVFEGSLKGVEKWAKGNAAAMGVTSREAVGMAANFADLLKPMGFTAKQAASMSTDVVGLSGALAQWTGGTRSAAEVSEILSKAMLGERDGLKELGISITEADVAARLAKKGQEDLTGAALEQAKALATQELIMEKSTDAQKAYANTQDTLGGKINSIKAKFKSLLEDGIVKLTPAMHVMADFAGKVLPVALGKLGDVVKGATRFVGRLVGGFGSGGKAATGWGDVLKRVAGFVRPVIAGIGATVSTIFAVIRRWLKNNQDTVSEWGTRFKSITKTVGAVLGVFRAIVVQILRLVAKAWRKWGDDVLSVVGKALGVALKIIDTALKVIRKVFTAVLKLLKGDWSGAWRAIKDAARIAMDGLIRLLKGAGSLAVRGLKAGISAAVRGIGSWVKAKIIDPVVGRFRNAGNWLKRTGKNILSGLKDGIVDAVRGIGDWVKRKIVDPVVGAVKRSFGIKSPSTVFKGIGGHLIGGLLKGMASSNGTAIAKKVFGDLPSALAAIVGKGLVAVSQLPKKALKALGGLGKAAWDALGDLGGTALDKLGGLGGAAKDALGGLGDLLGFGGGDAGKAPGNVSGNAALGRKLAAQLYGWTGRQWDALFRLGMNESGWRNTAQNPTSSAYGIGQFLNSTWATVGIRKTSDPGTQIVGMLRYIAQRYGSPVAALGAWNSRSPHWYDTGGILKPGFTPVMNATGRNEFVLTEQQMKAFGTRGGGDVKIYLTQHVPPNADLKAIGAATVEAIDAYVRRGGALTPKIKKAARS